MAQKVLLVLIAFLASSCMSEPEARVRPESTKGKKEKSSGDEQSEDAEGKSGKSKDFTSDEGEQSSDKDKDKGDSDEETSSGGTTKTDEDEGNGLIDYPLLDYESRGRMSCRGDWYDMSSAMNAKASETEFTLTSVRAQIHDDGRIGREGNEKLKESLGKTIYKRLTKKEKETWTKQGVDIGFYAIYSTGVTKTAKNVSYTFDKPLPVFPWPRNGDYSEIASPKAYTAKVSGSGNFTVAVTISRVAVTDEIATIKIATDIHEDKSAFPSGLPLPGGAGMPPMDPMQGKLYKDFPMAREAVYEINRKTRNVLSLSTVNWSWNEDCQGKQQIDAKYRLCKRTTTKKSDDYPCK